MIYDVFDNMTLYCREGDALYRAIDYARHFDSSSADGIYEIEGRDIYARVLSYETEPAAKRRFEAHRDYLDVQVVLTGCERIDVSLATEHELDELEPYDPEKDVVFYGGLGGDISMKMVPGRFALLYPDDVHRPNCDMEGASHVKKICVKVRLKRQDGNRKGSRWTIQ